MKLVVWGTPPCGILGILGQVFGLATRPPSSQPLYFDESQKESGLETLLLSCG